MLLARTEKGERALNAVRFSIFSLFLFLFGKRNIFLIFFPLSGEGGRDIASIVTGLIVSTYALNSLTLSQQQEQQQERQNLSVNSSRVYFFFSLSLSLSPYIRPSAHNISIELNPLFFNRVLPVNKNKGSLLIFVYFFSRRSN